MCHNNRDGNRDRKSVKSTCTSFDFQIDTSQTGLGMDYLLDSYNILVHFFQRDCVILRLQ